MTLRKRFNAAFKREPTEKEMEELKRVDDTWYGEHMDWNTSLFVIIILRCIVKIAQIFSDQIGDGKVYKLLGMDPKDSVKVFATLLESNDTMYVGHLPHMEKLVSYLTTGNEDAGVVKFANGGVICIESDGENFYIGWYLKPTICNV